MTERPPPIYPAARTTWVPLWVLLGFAGILIALPWLVRWNIPLPQCQWKRLTGIPCPACGSTRCLLSIASFQFASALRYNPLAFFLFCSVPVWSVFWAIDCLSRKNRLLQLQQSAAGKYSWPILGVVAGVNWIYLIFTLPR